MQRTKVFAVAAALVSTALAAVLLAGGASASAWHSYHGDMFPGHAYGLDVPRGAESIEFRFDGAEGGSASIGIYAPAGAKVGYYALSPALTAASVANPAPGRYVVYVYDVVEGALQVRVASDHAPAKLDLQKIELVREDVKIGSFQQGKLDQVITAELKAETVFVTLLYEGSSRDLDATVSSAKGAVVTITDESATAFSPGVWTNLQGTRAFDASMLDGTKYTVEVHAEQFEGSMVLTTLGLKIDAPATGPAVQPRVGPAPPAPPTAERPHARERVAFDTTSAHFALEEGIPLAFEASGGRLVIADPGALDEDRDGNRSYHDDCRPLHGVVAIYAPDDTLLGVLELSHDNATASIELPMKGEYVAYARHVEGEVLLARLEGADRAPAVRTLATETETFAIDRHGVLHMGGGAATMELSRAPVDLQMRFVDGIGTLSSLRLSNGKGTVAYADALAVVAGANMLQWASVEPRHFAKGEHALQLHGVYEGSVEIASTYYLREAPAPAPDAKHAHQEHEDHDRAAPLPEMPTPAQVPLPLLGPLAGRLPFG